jgi:hypothetical protein
MANLRGGGRIIIGVAEQDGRPRLDGMVREHEAGYTQDDLYALVNRYARPFVRLEIRFVEFDRKRFIGIEIREFERSFIFCGNAMPQEAGKRRLLVGDIPARNLDANTNASPIEHINVRHQKTRRRTRTTRATREFL